MLTYAIDANAADFDACLTTLTPKSSDIAAAVNAAVAAGDIERRAGATASLTLWTNSHWRRIGVVVTADDEKTLSADAVYRAVAKAAAALVRGGARKIALPIDDFIAVDGISPALLVSRVYAALDAATYRFDQFKSKKRPPAVDRELRVITGHTAAHDEIKQSLALAQAIAYGAKLTRDLANTPGNVCTPAYLAEQADVLARAHGLELDVLDEHALKALGCGALLAVAAGSVHTPRLIVLRYRGGDSADKPIALVGKGVTFDTGGISLKPPADMDEMKYDMCGAASVFGTMRAIVELQLPLNVIGVVPAVENMIGSRATRPGDIVTTLAGKTVEILNTDAEGRLILCDALTYVQRFSPAKIVDIATLTGAVIIALGHHHAAVLGNDQSLVDELRVAGDISGDTVWQLPLGEHYEELLKSPFADLANISPGRQAGTVTAAAFLGAFCRDAVWAHLDIAGVAWRSGEEKGATARPVALLTTWLQQLAMQR